jgi:hyperosmotically inducible periplasmic protein
MTIKRLVAFGATVALAALVAGCDNTNTNSNVANSNRAVVTNSNANTAGGANANANANANTKKAPTKEDVEKNKETHQKEAQGLGRKIGTGVNDTWLWVKTRYELGVADDLRDSTINVDVDNAVVTLSGTVASAEQKTKAGTVAQSVEGVKKVNNELKVSADSNKNGNANNSNTKKS